MIRGSSGRVCRYASSSRNLSASSSASTRLMYLNLSSSSSTRIRSLSRCKSPSSSTKRPRRRPRSTTEAAAPCTGAIARTIRRSTKEARAPSCAENINNPMRTSTTPTSNMACRFFPHKPMPIPLYRSLGDASSLLNRFKCANVIPAPSTTEVRGSSAMCTGMPVSAAMSLSSPRKSDPPPVMTMPRSMTSEASSGGVRSSVALTASTMPRTVAARA